jgi:hypothetical protein
MNTASLTRLGAKAKPIAQAIARWCEGESIGYDFEPAIGKHPRVRLSYNRQSRVVYFSSTASDFRTAENVLSNCRKEARLMGWKPRKEKPVEAPIVNSLADLPRLAETTAPEPQGVVIRYQHPEKAPAPPQQFLRKQLPAGRHNVPQLTKAIRERNKWVAEQKAKGRTDDAVWSDLIGAGWVIKSASNVSGMLSQHRRAEGAPVTQKAPGHEPEVQHRAPPEPQGTIDPLVLAIAEAIAPLIGDQIAKQRGEIAALKAKADKWDAIAGLVKDA